MMYKNIITSLLLLLVASIGFAQDCPKIQYTYDLSGNRTKQQHVVITNCSESRRGQTIQAKEAAPKLNVSVYPNPAQDKVSIELLPSSQPETNEPMQVFLYDAAGRELYSAKGVNNIIQVDIAGLATGIYSLTVIKGDKKSFYNVYKN